MWTKANTLTLLRVLAIPFLLVALARHAAGLAFWVFFAAACTDFLDGMAARGWNERSKFGTLFDPAADKLLMTASFIALSLPSVGGRNVIPLWLTGLVIGRDLAISLGALIVAKVLGPRPFLPSIWGKISTVLQMACLGLVLLFNMLDIAPPHMFWVFVLTFAATLVSGVHYFAARFVPWMINRKK